MAQSRKDSKGRVLRRGETERKSTGGYQYAYTDVWGKRRYLYAKTLVELRNLEDERFRDKLDGINSQRAKQTTLNQMFDKYMSTRGDLSLNTYKSYIYVYDKHVRNSLGRRSLNDIKYSDALMFYKLLLEEKKLSLGSVELINRAISPVFEMAVRDCIIRYNPLYKIIGKVKKQTGSERGVRQALTPQQTLAFLQYMDGHPVYDHCKAVFTFLLGTGLRIGELSGLTWNDIDFDKGYITIDHALVYCSGRLNKSENRLYIKKPKTTAGIRKIPMLPEVRQALEENRQYQKERGIVCKSKIDGYSDFVFLNRFGNTLMQSAVDRNLSRIIQSYNDFELYISEKEKREPEYLPHFTCHTLRHTFCSRLCENETNLKVIQTVMGHSDIKTTMNIYAEVSNEKVKESIDKLSEKLNLGI